MNGCSASTGASRWRRRRPISRGPSGLTLLELLIVIAIIAGLAIAGLVTLNDLSRATLRAEVMRFSGYVKYSYGQAALRQQYHRLVIDLDSNQYWTEVAEREEVGAPPVIPENTLIGTPERFQDDAPSGRHRDEDVDPEGGAFGLRRPRFGAEESKLVKKRGLEGVSFHSVVTSRDEHPIEAGQVSMVFYPSGFVDRTRVVITDDEGGFYTLEVQPMSGKVIVFNGKMDLDRDFFEVEDDG